VLAGGVSYGNSFVWADETDGLIATVTTSSTVSYQGQVVGGDQAQQQQQQQLNPNLLEDPTVPSAPVDGISCSGAQVPCSVTLVGGGDPNKSGSANIWTEVLWDTYGNPISGAQVDEFIISGDGSSVRTGTGVTNGDGKFTDTNGWTNVPMTSWYSVDLQLTTVTMNNTNYALPQFNWINTGWSNGILNYAFPFIP